MRILKENLDGMSRRIFLHCRAVEVAGDCLIKSNSLFIGERAKVEVVYCRRAADGLHSAR